MQSIENLLNNFVNRKMVPVEMREYRFFRDWSVIVGQAISNKSRPLGFRGNRLLIVVTSSAWAQTLKMNSEDLLYKVNKNLQFTQVKGLDFQVVNKLPTVGEPKQNFCTSNSNQCKNVPTAVLGSELEEINKISAEVLDDETRNVVHSLGIKIYAHPKN